MSTVNQWQTFLPVVVHPLDQFVQRQALFLLPGGFPDQEALPHRGAEAVDADHLAFGVLFLEFRCTERGCLEGPRNAGGEAEVEYILPLLQARLKVFQINGRIDLRSGGKLAVPPRPRKIPLR